MNKEHKFTPLKIAEEGSSSAQVIVTCFLTKKSLAWNDAVRAGWVADSNGPAFQAYYCSEAVKELKKS